MTSVTRPGTDGDELLDVNQVSEWLKYPPGTLHYWKHAGKGPRCARIGRHLRYRRADVEAWLEAAFAGGEDTNGGAA